jgi:hypothetical protein
MLPENLAVDRVLQILEFKNGSASYVKKVVAFVAHARISDISGKLVRVAGDHRFPVD